MASLVHLIWHILLEAIYSERLGCLEISLIMRSCVVDRARLRALLDSSVYAGNITGLYVRRWAVTAPHTWYFDLDPVEIVNFDGIIP